MKTGAGFGASASWLRSGLVPRSSPKNKRFVSILPSAQKDGSGKSISLGDKLLDYIEGGPKLRKWYGASEESAVDPEEQDQLQTTEEEIRDAVLVTDADSETGQMIVLSLIVKRNRVRVLVNDAKLATAAFGAYVEPVVGNVNDKGSLLKACKGVRAIICPTKLGALTDKQLLKGVERIVYLSEVASLRSAKGLMSLLRSGATQRAINDESAIAELGVSYTIIRTAELRNEPGGRLGIAIRKVDQNDSSNSMEDKSISREDAAMVCVEAVNAGFEESMVFEVANENTEVKNIEAAFAELSRTQYQ